MKRKHKGGVALIGNRPPYTGIGVYQRCLAESIDQLLSSKEFQSYELISPPTRTNNLVVDLISHSCRQLMLLTHISESSSLYHFSSPGFPVLYSLLRDVPSVVTIHDMYVKDRLHPEYGNPREPLTVDKFLEPLTDISVSRCSAIIAASDFTKGRIEKYFGNTLKVSVIHYGINSLLFTPRDRDQARQLLRLPKTVPIVLYVGDSLLRKNWDTLFSTIRALNARSGKRILFLIVGGDSRICSSMTRQIRADNVVHLANVGRSQIPYYYNAADVFLFTSRYEGFGIPPLESMASGTPVVSSSATGLAEVLGKSGIQCNWNDGDSFVSGVLSVLEDRGVSESLAESGLVQSRKFTWARAAVETINVYRDVMRG